MWTPEQVEEFNAARERERLAKCTRCHAPNGEHEHWCLCLSEVGDVMAPDDVCRECWAPNGEHNTWCSNSPRACACNGVGCSACTDDDGLPV